MTAEGRKSEGADAEVQNSALHLRLRCRKIFSCLDDRIIAHAVSNTSCYLLRKIRSHKRLISLNRQNAFSMEVF